MNYTTHDSTVKLCETCGNQFKVAKYRIKTAKWCSKKCWSNRRKPNLKACDTCGNQFDAIDHRARFCSHECLLSWKSGETSPVWKGGKAAHRKRGQLKSELVKWRIAVYQRDKYTCQSCGAKGNIHAHHIKPLADNFDLALDVDNGITLCVKCHEKVHNRKLSSPAKYQKKCVDCSAKTTGKSLRCRTCSNVYACAERRKNKSKQCGQCNNSFVPGRSDYKYCSAECRRNASYENKDVKCSICDKTVSRANSLIKRNKSGAWYCSLECQRSRPTNNIELTCPICQKAFSVKKYRTKQTKVITCSRECGYKQIKLHRLSKLA